MLLKWFPPAWFQIRTAEALIYIDPAYLTTHFVDYPSKIEFSRWPNPIDGLPEKLEPADIILVTHAHKDHCKRVTVDRLRTAGTLVLAPKGCLSELTEGDTAIDASTAPPIDESLRIVKPGDKITRAGVKVRVVEAYNTQEGDSTQKLHKKGLGVGYLVTAEGKTIYHAGDTDLIPEMAELGAIDVALLPIGGTYTMDALEAVEAAMRIAPKIVVPMHRLKADPLVFRYGLETRSDIEVAALRTGETLEIGGVPQ